MPQLGSNSSPIMIKGKKTGKVIGLTGSFYSGESKKKYEDNYDAIFGKDKNKSKAK